MSALPPKADIPTLLRKRAGVSGFRFHDFRHDFASKLLRETGNLKLVQRALKHADLKTTSRYAHVLDEEVAEAMERVRSPGISPEPCIARWANARTDHDNAACAY